MTLAQLLTRDEDGVSVETPHLSHSRVNRYLHCPEQYRLYYVENLRPRQPAANLMFGQVVHQALAGLFREGEDPADLFDRAWRDLKDIDLDYGKKDSWEKLHDMGRRLLDRFLSDELDRLSNIRDVEEPFRLQITDFDHPFVGVIDLVAALDGVSTVIDFKTAASSFEEHEAGMSDQLTAYRLARPDTEQAALCVLVKTKEPKIEWHLTRRTPDQIAEYLAKVGYVAREITSGRFYKRPGKWCGWCDYLPVCLGDKKGVEQTLIKIR